MPKTSLKELIEDARNNIYSLGCFNAVSMESLESIIESAQKLQSPVVISIFEPHFKYSCLEDFMVLVNAKAQRAGVPVVLQLDYIRDLKRLEDAVKMGFTSLMYVGREGLSFNDKITEVRKAVEISHSFGLMCESELGELVFNTESTGNTIKNKDEKETLRKTLEFVSSTGIDILSPDIGSVHGQTPGNAPDLNISLLKEIRNNTSCYLALHGGSGVSDDLIKDAVKSGINKMSVYSKCSISSINEIKDYLKSGKNDLIELLNKSKKGFSAVVENRLEVFGSKNRAAINKSIKKGLFSEEDITEIIASSIIEALRNNEKN